jgi:tRNA1(Val) A37 N6-methylase TrmN6
MLGWFQPTSVKRIVDATAHIGVDSIHMSELFPYAKIDSFEIDNVIYRKLVNNIITFKKEGIITPHYGDATLWQPPYTVDFLYVDPPWGGLDYVNKDAMNLYLQSEKNEPNEEKNVVNVIRNWFATGKVRNGRI